MKKDKDLVLIVLHLKDKFSAWRQLRFVYLFIIKIVQTTHPTKKEVIINGSTNTKLHDR